MDGDPRQFGDCPSATRDRPSHEFLSHSTSLACNEQHRHVLALAHLDETNQLSILLRYENEVSGFRSLQQLIRCGIPQELLDTFIAIAGRNELVENTRREVSYGFLFARLHQPIH